MTTALLIEVGQSSVLRNRLRRCNSRIKPLGLSRRRTLQHAAAGSPPGLASAAPVIQGFDPFEAAWLPVRDGAREGVMGSSRP
jgi:hypothetical protein